MNTLEVVVLIGTVFLLTVVAVTVGVLVYVAHKVTRG